MIFLASKMLQNREASGAIYDAPQCCQDALKCFLEPQSASKLPCHRARSTFSTHQVDWAIDLASKTPSQSQKLAGFL